MPPAISHPVEMPPSGRMGGYMYTALRPWRLYLTLWANPASTRPGADQNDEDAQLEWAINHPCWGVALTGGPGEGMWCGRLHAGTRSGGWLFHSASQGEGPPTAGVDPSRAQGGWWSEWTYHFRPLDPSFLVFYEIATVEPTLYHPQPQGCPPSYPYHQKSDWTHDWRALRWNGRDVVPLAQSDSGASSSGASSGSGSSPNTSGPGASSSNQPMTPVSDPWIDIVASNIKCIAVIKQLTDSARELTRRDGTPLRYYALFSEGGRFDSQQWALAVAGSTMRGPMVFEGTPGSDALWLCTDDEAGLYRSAAQAARDAWRECAGKPGAFRVVKWDGNVYL